MSDAGNEVSERGSADVRQGVVEALRSVHDPEIPVNIYDLGLIYELDVDGQGGVRIRMTLTTPNCPVAESLPAAVKEAAAGVQGVRDVDLDLVWEPRWTPAMITDEGRMELELHGVTLPEPGGRKDPFTNVTMNRRRQD